MEYYRLLRFVKLKKNAPRYRAAHVLSTREVALESFIRPTWRTTFHRPSQQRLIALPVERGRVAGEKVGQRMPALESWPMCLAAIRDGQNDLRCASALAPGTPRAAQRVTITRPFWALYLVK